MRYHEQAKSVLMQTKETNMKPFDLEKARNGAQIVHVDGRNAEEWHYFEQVNTAVVMWEGGSIGWYYTDSRQIGLAPDRVDRVVEYVAFDKAGFYSGFSTIGKTQRALPEAIAYFKVSADEDGGNPTIEEVK
jgi:hypothetical protein